MKPAPHKRGRARSLRPLRDPLGLPPHGSWLTVRPNHHLVRSTGFSAPTGRHLHGAPDGALFSGHHLAKTGPAEFQSTVWHPLGSSITTRVAPPRAAFAATWTAALIAAGAADHHDRTMPSFVTAQRFWIFLTMNWFKADAQGARPPPKGADGRCRRPRVIGRSAAPRSPTDPRRQHCAHRSPLPTAAIRVARCAQEHTAPDSQRGAVRTSTARPPGPTRLTRARGRTP